MTFSSAGKISITSNCFWDIFLIYGLIKRGDDHYASNQIYAISFEVETILVLMIIAAFLCCTGIARGEGSSPAAVQIQAFKYHSKKKTALGWSLTLNLFSSAVQMKFRQFDYTHSLSMTSSLSWPDSSTGEALHQHFRGQGLSPIQAWVF